MKINSNVKEHIKTPQIIKMIGSIPHSSLHVVRCSQLTAEMSESFHALNISYTTQAYSFCMFTEGTNWAQKPNYRAGYCEITGGDKVIVLSSYG